jgi:hypothetical protein
MAYGLFPKSDDGQVCKSVHICNNLFAVAGKGRLDEALVMYFPCAGQQKKRPTVCRPGGEVVKAKSSPWLFRANSWHQSGIYIRTAAGYFVLEQFWGRAVRAPLTRRGQGRFLIVGFLGKVFFCP